MICPKCQFNNPDMAGFCKKCGASLIHGDIEKQQPVKLKKIDPALFAFPLWGGLAAIIVGIILLAASQDSAAGPLLAFAGVIGVIYAVTYGYIALYRSWALIRGKTARTTPGKAVGFNFIPFYNLYWIFVSVKGLAEDMNSFLDKADVKVQRISVKMSLWTCISLLLSNVPFIGGIAALAMGILSTKLVYQWASVVNHPETEKAFHRTDIVFKPVKAVGASLAVMAVVGVIGGIFIVGIVAAIAIPQFAAYKQMANDDAAELQMLNLAVSMEGYFVSNSNYGDPKGTGGIAQAHLLKEHGYIKDPNIIIIIPSDFTPCAAGTEGLSCWSADAYHFAESGMIFTWNSEQGGMQW